MWIGMKLQWITIGIPSFVSVMTLTARQNKSEPNYKPRKVCQNITQNHLTTLEKLGHTKKN